MQFRDLAKQYEVLKPQIDEAMVRVAASASLTSASTASTFSAG